MADIVLRDRSGAKINYPGITNVKLNTVDGGTAEFIDADSIPEVVENVHIALDFSGGNQIVSLPDGVVAKSAIIEKPENLISENLPEGLDIAGVTGTRPSGGGGSGPVKFASGTITPSGSSATITHNLGVVPDFMCVVAQVSISNGYIIYAYNWSAAMYERAGATLAGAVYTLNGTSVTLSASGSLESADSTGWGTFAKATDKTAALGGSMFKLQSSKKYHWFAISGLT